MRKKQLLLALAVPLAIAGWALFRPELLFVNKSVSETLPVTSGASVETLSQGKFVSYAHETNGTAEIVNSGGKRFLRLSGFETSNGPDVHVLLVKSSDPQALGNMDYLDLGSIKGNRGDQNYELPASFQEGEFQSVTIWCKRFNVNFGGATLKSSAPKTAQNVFRLASFDPAGEIRVTSGKLTSGGSAQIIEASGKRFLTVSTSKALKGAEVYLFKKESLTASQTPSEGTSVRVGTLGAKSGRFSLSKELDLWLYRSVLVWDPVAKKAIGITNLRSDQERAKGKMAV
jgi:hypothetical protein